VVLGESELGRGIAVEVIPKEHGGGCWHSLAWCHRLRWPMVVGQYLDISSQDTLELVRVASRAGVLSRRVGGKVVGATVEGMAGYWWIVHAAEYGVHKGTCCVIRGSGKGQCSCCCCPGRKTMLGHSVRCPEGSVSWHVVVCQLFYHRKVERGWGGNGGERWQGRKVHQLRGCGWVGLAGGIGVRVAACRREEEQSRSCISHRIWCWSAFKSAIALSCHWVEW